MGNPLVHFDFVADNPEALAQFYKKLFDWKITKSEGGEDYWMIDTGSEPGGGLMQRTSPEQMQTIYFDVDSIEDYARKARDLGAQVVVEKTAVGDMGWFAVLVDPQGNGFAIWELSEDYSPPT